MRAHASSSARSPSRPSASLSAALMAAIAVRRALTSSRTASHPIGVAAAADPWRIHDPPEGLAPAGDCWGPSSPAGPGVGARDHPHPLGNWGRTYSPPGALVRVLGQLSVPETFVNKGFPG